MNNQIDPMLNELKKFSDIYAKEIIEALCCNKFN